MKPDQRRGIAIKQETVGMMRKLTKHELKWDDVKVPCPAASSCKIWDMSLCVIMLTRPVVAWQP